MKILLIKLYHIFFAGLVNALFFHDLVWHTRNFSQVKWLGHPVWQNVPDLWTLQETITEVKPELLIECGTNKGGSSLFFAHLFDLLGHGSVVTIDVEKLHDLSHPRIAYLLGSSTSDEIVAAVRNRVSETRGPVMVILDSDHAMAHVLRELECYAPFVTPGSFCLVQDGVIDTLAMFRRNRPGPMRAVEAYLKTHPEFEIDVQRTQRFLITHHPKGWLKRKS